MRLYTSGKMKHRQVLTVVVVGFFLLLQGKPEFYFFCKKFNSKNRLQKLKLGSTKTIRNIFAEICTFLYKALIIYVYNEHYGKYNKKF